MNFEKKFPYYLVFYKDKEMVYFSQLDIYSLLLRALRRAKLPLYFTKGFNPHPKVSFLNSLKLGKEGDLKVIIYLTEIISCEEIKQKLSLQLPLGLKIIECNFNG